MDNENDLQPDNLEREVDKKASLLFVDDEKNILSSLKRLFRSEGYHIHLANSGAEGLEVLENNPIDLVISDMRMPEMNGAEFLEKVSTRWPKITRILLTGYSEISATIDAINKGNIYKYISKPWEDNDIKLTVRNALEVQQIELERDRLLALTKKQNEQLKDFNTNLENMVKARTAELDQTMGMYETAYSTLKESYTSTVKVISNIIEIREGSKKGLARKVAEQAGALAEKLGMDSDNIQQVSYAGMLRDIGKIGFPDNMINKPIETMDTQTRTHFAKHPIIGAGILMALEPLQTTAKIIRSHCEYYDGKGYPNRLSGEKIPIGSKILSVVSDYHALQSGNLVAHRMTAKEASNFLLNHRGTRYDPKVVNTFLNLLGDNEDTPPELIGDRISSSALENGMVLARDLVTSDGVLLLAKGHELVDRLIDGIKNLEQSLNETLIIYIQR